MVFDTRQAIEVFTIIFADDGTPIIQPISPPSGLSYSRIVAQNKLTADYRFGWLQPFSWGDDDSGANTRRYEYQWRVAPAAYSAIASTTSNSFQIANRVVGNHIFFRVRAVNKNNERSAWSDTDTLVRAFNMGFEGGFG